MESQSRKDARVANLERMLAAFVEVGSRLMPLRGFESPADMVAFGSIYGQAKDLLCDTPQETKDDARRIVEAFRAVPDRTE